MWSLGEAASQGYVDARVGKCRPRYWELLRALFELGVKKFEKRPVITVESSQRLIIDARVTNTAFEALDPGTLAT